MRKVRSAVFVLALVATVLCAAPLAHAGRPPAMGTETQLFVDDVLLAAKTGVVRRAHACRKLPQPVLVPEKPWEQDGIDRRVYIYGTVLREPAAGTFRMWYNRLATVLFATSADGIDWERPTLGLVEFGGSKENNILLEGMHSPSVVCDLYEPDPARRYKMIGCWRGKEPGYYAAYSADGLRWNLYPKNPVLPGGDTITLAQDPSTGEYLAFHKRHGDPRTRPIARQVYLSVSDDMQTWSEPELVMIPDKIDHAQTRELEGGTHSEFYNMSAFPYGGQWLGLVTHFRRTGRPPGKGPGQSPADGPIDVQLVHSRDGRTWQRGSDRSPVIPNGPHAYDAGCILGVANAPVMVDDQLWVYYTGITTTHGGYLPEKEITIALAKWRLDGFVSLDAGDEPGMVETVPLRFHGDRPMVNADASEGFLAVEVLDAEGQPIPGYTRAECTLVLGDSVRHEVGWKQHKRLPADRPVRLRFHLHNTKLFSYRVDLAE